MLQYGSAFALTTSALVLFQYFSHRAREDQRTHNLQEQERSKREMFQEDQERHKILPGENAAGSDAPTGDSGRREI
jgi:hypothetical protein